MEPSTQFLGLGELGRGVVFLGVEFGVGDAGLGGTFFFLKRNRGVESGGTGGFGDEKALTVVNRLSET